MEQVVHLVDQDVLVVVEVGLHRLPFHLEVLQGHPHQQEDRHRQHRCLHQLTQNGGFLLGARLWLILICHHAPDSSTRFFRSPTHLSSPPTASRSSSSRLSGTVRRSSSTRPFWVLA